VENFNPSIRTGKSQNDSFGISFPGTNHQTESHPPHQNIAWEKYINILRLQFEAFQV
jgi:hypothetical protein